MTVYHFRIPDTKKARGSIAELSFQSLGAESIAETLQAALREDGLFQRWRALQDEPDEVDEMLGETDPNATVRGAQSDLAVDLTVSTVLPGQLLLQRLRLLAGSHWEMRDVTAA